MIFPSYPAMIAQKGISQQQASGKDHLHQWGNEEGCEDEHRTWPGCLLEGFMGFTKKQRWFNGFAVISWDFPRNMMI